MCLIIMTLPQEFFVLKRWWENFQNGQNAYLSCMCTENYPYFYINFCLWFLFFFHFSRLVGLVINDGPFWVSESSFYNYVADAQNGPTMAGALAFNAGDSGQRSILNRFTTITFDAVCYKLLKGSILLSFY